MRNLIFMALLISVLMGCNQQQSGSSISPEEGLKDSFKSENKNGKHTTDFETAQELISMRFTIENFTLLNKKKFENLKAYQEFGDLMQMHIERITRFCKLDVDTKNLLCKKLEGITKEVEILHGSDMEKSKEALGKINYSLGQIDSTFNYSN
jgi:hypothetical protein